MDLKLVLVFVVAQFAVFQAAEVLEYKNVQTPDGYYFKYKTTTGVTREETGRFRDDGVWQVEGSYTWTDAKGKTNSYKFIADNKGFRKDAPTKTGAKPLWSKLLQSLG